MRGSHPVDDHVIHERTVRRQESRILRLSDLQPRGVAAGDRLDGRQCVGAGDLDFAHVTDVEHASPRADREVLARDARYSTGMSHPAKGTMRACRAR